MAYTNVTRVSQATKEQLIARARRNCNLGSFFVERFWQSQWSNDPTRGYFNIVSSHVTLEAAEKALAKLNRKIAKEMK